VSEVNDDAVRAAAKATGLRPDQIEAAVSEYRAAASALYGEPEWTAVMHILGTHQYADPEGLTRVTMQIDEHKARGGWVQDRCYIYRGKPYETFGEARAVEVNETTRTKPREVKASQER